LKLKGLYQMESQMRDRGMRARGDRGFTLIELMIAIALLSFGLLAVASMQIAAMRGNASAMGTTEALAIAQSMVEELFAQPLPVPTAGTDFEDTTGDAVNGLDFPTRAEVIAAGDAVIPAGGAAGSPDHARTVNPGTRNYYVYWNLNPMTSSTTINVIVAWHDKTMHRVNLSFIKY